jgi:heat-inducible transcriptional repressor
MLDDRKAAILRAVVEEYIHTAQPVGSAHVAKVPDLSVSSATVRNEMGVLEREGYLVQPYTSAGRIPTDKGYRFFVDSLAQPGPLGPTESLQVRSFFSHAHGELERMLGDTSRLLSGLTSYAAVVTSPAHHEVPSVRSVQLVALSPRVVVVVAVHSNGALDKRTLELGEDVSEDIVTSAATHLARHVVGAPAGSSPFVGPSGDVEVDRLVGVAVDALSQVNSLDSDDQIFVGGAASMASAFDAVDTIRQVLGILEQQVVIVAMLRDVLDRGLSVAIGTEHGIQPLADCSVIVAPYRVEGEPAGTIGVLGPTRMRYEQALAAVAVVSERLGRALSDSAGRE